MAGSTASSTCSRTSRDLQIWLTENRLHRSPNKMPDGPGKSIWGAEQKEWLKRTLRESDATFKVLISPTPMIGPDDLRKTDNHTNVGGFRHERDEFFTWLKETGLDSRNFCILCGDRHWQYRSLHPSGIEEFSCGALVDENSRLGRKPGDPKSTDPDGEIRQPYCQDPASGGFLLVAVAPAGDDGPAQLAFTFCDEHGKTLYRNVKVASEE
jgi:alkaline phosphatase D